jgi:Ca-activated chloride channel family protein
MRNFTLTFTLRLRLTLAAAVAVWLPGAAALGARGQQPAPAPAFHTETRIVVLQATVKNTRGELVTDLDRSAFTVYENGKSQPITVFRRDDVPVSLGVLIDNSGSMRTLRAKVEAAALAFARACNPQDEFFVVNFADIPHVDVSMTRDVQILEAGIARVDAIGGTAMYDALDLAQTYTREHASRDRKALLLITDGNDNASLTSLDRIEADAQRADIVIDAIGLFGDASSSTAKRARHELDRLTNETGGVVYYPASIEDIGPVVLDLARQIRTQYTIAYTPLNQRLDGSYRSIRVSAQGREKLAVRTRSGYRATPPAASRPTSPRRD